MEKQIQDSLTLGNVARLIGGATPPQPGIPVTAVTQDSRRVRRGALFVAAPGHHADGHDFAQAAVDAGAIAIVGERPGLETLYGVPYLRVHNARRALGVLAHALARYPSQSLIVAGITGTNGKSSCALLTRQILERRGARCACLGTLGYYVGGELKNAPYTTPFAEDLATLLGAARDAGDTYAVMEVSSHAIEQERIAGIDFHVAAFTNLTQDHLDYHQDMEQYLEAKLGLFRRIHGPGRFVTVNVDDPSAGRFIEAASVECIRFGANGEVRAEKIRTAPPGMRFRLRTPWGDSDASLPLLGAHNISNALCALSVCGGLGVPIETMTAALAEAPIIPGRFERVDAGQPFTVVVDYAHTEDGLRNVLKAARAICAGRIICLFGCGGDRDRGKRPKMAQAAAELADFSIITSDNPRTEDPERIILDIEAGMQRAEKRLGEDYLRIVDRAEAIRHAIATAKPGDLVLIAGKGHEDYQILGTKRIHFDDREQARLAIKERHS